MKSEPSPDQLATDLLWGAKAIASYLGLEERQAFYIAESGCLPIMRVGRKLVASKSALARHFGVSNLPLSTS
jgi:hypothetical protein